MIDNLSRLGVVFVAALVVVAAIVAIGLGGWAIMLALTVGDLLVGVAVVVVGLYALWSVAGTGGRL